MASSTDYSIHEQACKEFFDELALDLEQTDEQVGSRTYDITGWDALDTVELLKSIVNSESYIQDQLFRLKIYSQEGEQVEVFTLKARPTTDQPGNGFLSLGEEQGRTYSQLQPLLKDYYGYNSRSFARDLKKLFKNNKDIAEVGSATREVYMLLLFEMARRLVTQQQDPDEEREIDKLPIGSAIARIVNLLEAEEVTFEDVFATTGKLHCFSGTVEERKKAVNQINRAYAHLLVKNELHEMFTSTQGETEEDEESQGDLTNEEFSEAEVGISNINLNG